MNKSTETTAQSETDLFQQLQQALQGGNADQQRIAHVGLQWLTTILAKNRDYGSSVWKAPALKPSLSPGDAILVRMSDKVSRIASLSTQAPQVAESLEDTVQDLGAYALLWLARPQTAE